MTLEEEFSLFSKAEGIETPGDEYTSSQKESISTYLISKERVKEALDNCRFSIKGYDDMVFINQFATELGL